MPPTPFEPQPDELSGYRTFIGIQHDAIRQKLDGLTDEQALSAPTASDLCMLTLAKHAAFCERRWMRAVGRLDMTGYWPPSDPGEELRVDPGDTVTSMLALLDEVGAASKEILAADVDLDTVDDSGLNSRWILLHLIEELARHAGHADILRESLDGTTGV
ncbi:MAG TPA: DinB family protein [Acidimicrobiales bacterium]|nr:DinB family protein [Acidimicrobiales bacterium]